MSAPAWECNRDLRASVTAQSKTCVLTYRRQIKDETKLSQFSNNRQNEPGFITQSPVFIDLCMKEDFLSVHLI
jgi:hypothetical protein